jgi:hypothetical protein
MPVGRPPTYPFHAMNLGDVVQLPAPTSADVKRICRNASQYGIRTGRFYQCRTIEGVTTITRVE